MGQQLLHLGLNRRAQRSRFYVPLLRSSIAVESKDAEQFRVGGWVIEDDAIAETADSNRYGLVSDACVLAAYRGRRIASRLIEAIEAIEAHLVRAGGLFGVPLSLTSKDHGDHRLQLPPRAKLRGHAGSGWVVSSVVSIRRAFRSASDLPTARLS